MGWLSATMGRRTPRAWAVLAVFGAIAAATVLLIGVQAAFASHPEVSLAGSNFEIDTDANLKVDDPAPSLDWANVTENRKADSPSGNSDESFGQGTKEDTAVPSVVDGSIPPNKSDLKFFGIYQEGSTSNGFLNLYWSRVQDPSGTTNMDFEFNQSNTPSANGVTPVRTAGDLLIIYDLSNGGTKPTLSLREWTGSKWGPATDLTGSNKATGSINISPIPAAEAEGLGSQSARTFGEAQINLSAIFTDPTVCKSFGSAYLKSRSSDSFTAALKDFVPPAAINVSNCGSVEITKTDDDSPASPLAGAVFEAYKDNAPVGGTRGNEDTATGKKCTTDADGKCTISNLLAGEYWIVETTTPAGHDTAADKHVTITADTKATLTFVDPRQQGAIAITKTAKHKDLQAGSPNLVAGFTLKDKDGNQVGQEIFTNASGKACVGNLQFGDYELSETTVPNGYEGDASVKSVKVDNKASCDGNGGTTSTAGEGPVSFVNTPLTNLTVSVDSQIDGGTASTISCKDASNNTKASGSTAANGDGSATASNLEPGTYTCTVVVDP